MCLTQYPTRRPFSSLPQQKIKRVLHCEPCWELRRRSVTMMCPKPNKTRAKYMLFGRSTQENCARWNLKIFIGRWPLFQLTFCFSDDSHFSLTANYLEGIFWELFIIHLLADEFIAFILTEESHKQRHNLILFFFFFLSFWSRVDGHNTALNSPSIMMRKRASALLQSYWTSNRPPPHHLSLSLRAPAHKIYEPWHEAIAIIKEKHDVKRRKKIEFFNFTFFFRLFRFVHLLAVKTDNNTQRKPTETGRGARNPTKRHDMKENFHRWSEVDCQPMTEREHFN